MGPIYIFHVVYIGRHRQRAAAHSHAADACTQIGASASVSVVARFNIVKTPRRSPMITKLAPRAAASTSTVWSVSACRVIFSGLQSGARRERVSVRVLELVFIV